MNTKYYRSDCGPTRSFDNQELDRLWRVMAKLDTQFNRLTHKRVELQRQEREYILLMSSLESEIESLLTGGHHD